ncbi:MAG: hypothetical protein KAT83_02430 [Candidatus Aenigmarchaeota archaeon]|nr:hypothetical protein [Candidatus Aenigmarchaeota archaeon]
MTSGSIIGTLLPVLKNAENRSEIKIISHQFQYAPGWNPDTQFYKELERLLTTKTASIKLLGGMPPEESYRGSLEELYGLGADVRILDEPPTENHIFIYKPLKPEDGFLWIEEKHKDDSAHHPSYNCEPSWINMEKSNNLFNKSWEKGTPFAEVGISE